MEKIKSICALRDLICTIQGIEQQLEERTQASLYEAMLLCALSTDEITPTELANRLGLRAAHTSKIIAQAEQRKWLVRRMADEDKRKMYLSLTESGLKQLELLRTLEFDVPKELNHLF